MLDRGLKNFNYKYPKIGLKGLGLNGMRFLIVASFYKYGGYYTTFPHKGANTVMSNLFNNEKSYQNII